MERSTNEVVRATGITSRTLRHYDHIRLLPPTSLGPGGLRYYDQRALVRLQRILLLRSLGMPLTDIERILDGDSDDLDALHEHRDRLLRERERIDTQMRSVTATIRALSEGESIMPQTMFDGFDHTQYDDEVHERWGAEAAARSNDWWSGLGAEGRQQFQQKLEDLNNAWDQVIASGVDPTSEPAQDVAGRHVDWLSSSRSSHKRPVCPERGNSSQRLGLLRWSR